MADSFELVPGDTLRASPPAFQLTAIYGVSRTRIDIAYVEYFNGYITIRRSGKLRDKAFPVRAFDSHHFREIFARTLFVMTGIGKERPEDVGIILDELENLIQRGQKRWA